MEKVGKRNLDDLADIAWWIKGYTSCSEINTCGDRLFTQDHVESLKVGRELMLQEMKKEEVVVVCKDKIDRFDESMLEDFLALCPECNSNVNIIGSECCPGSEIGIECGNNNCDMEFTLIVINSLSNVGLKKVLTQAWNSFCAMNSK